VEYVYNILGSLDDLGLLPDFGNKESLWTIGTQRY